MTAPRTIVNATEAQEILEDYEDGDNPDCWNCGGEGYYPDCWEEWACIYPEEGCDACMRKCDVCRGKGTL